MSAFEIRSGDVLDVLRTLPDESVHCVVTAFLGGIYSMTHGSFVGLQGSQFLEQYFHCSNGGSWHRKRTGLRETFSIRRISQPYFLNLQNQFSLAALQDQERQALSDDFDRNGFSYVHPVSWGAFCVLCRIFLASTPEPRLKSIQRLRRSQRERQTQDVPRGDRFGRHLFLTLKRSFPINKSSKIGRLNLSHTSSVKRERSNGL